MTDLLKENDRNAQMAKTEVEAEKRFALVVQDSGFVLQMMSRGGNDEDMKKHSPCLFCGHQGKASCPEGLIKKFGPCPHYTPKFESSRAFQIRLLMYLQEPPMARLNRAAA